MTSFAESFWGGKNNGFYVLYHNMKHGQTSSKDLMDFLRESCQVEETYSKLLTKLAKVAANNTQVGTFAPFWAIMRTLADKLASLHMQLVHTWSDLMKDIIRYNDEQHKRHKTMKEGESGTLEVVQSIQNTTTALHKAKELYHTRCLELERLKRENSSPKDIEKSETRYKKAKEDYKTLVDKYAKTREEFQNKMVESCTHFQELEEEHICQMKDFIDTYARAMQNEHVLFGQAQEEFRNSCDSLSVQKLLTTFIEAKSTGKEKPAMYKGVPVVDPGPLEFVEPDLSSLPSQRPMSPEVQIDKRDSISEKSRADSSGSASPIPTDQPGPLSRSVKLRVSRTWFLKKRRKKAKKNKEDKDSESIDTQESGDSKNAPEVDEEGYTIRPPSPDLNPENGDSKSWYDSSDSDSDNEPETKIKVHIKPISPTGTQAATGNVDDIRISMGMLRLSPTLAKKGRSTPVEKKVMKRSQSESDTLDGVSSKSSTSHLLNLDNLFTSSASTPTGHLPSPLSPFNDGPSSNFFEKSATNPSPQSIANTSDHLSQSGSSDMGGSSSSQPVENGVVPPTIPQRPPSRGVIPQVPARPSSGCPSPFSLNRIDSSANVQWNTTSMPIGSSRGPSPLTIGMADTVPLAVAFTETINAYFKGTDATKCSVKMSGNLMMSFPAGVVRVFMDNPNPAPLSFKLKNSSRLDQILLNKQLVTQDTGQSIEGSDVYTFDMPALSDHLRSQGETNKSASYFNIDILKYQIKTQPGVESTPLPVVVYWKCEEKVTDYRLDYRFNAPAMTSGATLKNISATVIVDGGVSSMQSLPEGVWNNETKRATWKLNDISEVSENSSQGSIRAKFALENGKSTPSTTALQFLAEGSTLSGIDFELVGPGYRISLSKKRCGAGKYLADPDQATKHV
ncbi:F-BAR domain only protein 2-like isoform X3 [Dreissena polymorpha]|uniref:F-BAR domain only protein 2-like isoform X3 n=1 Tax=Dreissena polymorpha TaxID=45954 RepID=UPI002263FAD3|nr:F-BAR domain only protein 2-like isoform X3 [Dreissena polymorpha]